jgi:hypothetical protein
MERIFENSGIGSSIGAVGSQYDDEDAYVTRIRTLIDDAVDYEESFLAPAREVNQKFYHGIYPTLDGPDTANGEEGFEEDKDNRSSFVSTDVRDTILTVLPSLIRIFLSADERIAEFIPNTPEQQDMADQQFDYLNYVISNDNDGFMLYYSAFKDALTVKAGIVKWWTDTDHEVDERTYRNISLEQLQALIYEDNEIEIVDLQQSSEDVIDSVTVRFVKSKPVHKICPVPPDEFRISRRARSIETADLVGHETFVDISDLVKKGYNPDELREYVSSSTIEAHSDERFIRNPALVDESYRLDGVKYGEWYVRADRDGDGINELRRICTIGDNRMIIEDEVVAAPRFAVFACDPTPHTLIGDCLADITRDIQLMKSRMMRGQLDNLSEMLNPRMVINDLMTNVEDALSDDIGAIIRTSGDPNASVAYTRVPYAGAEIQSSIDYLDRVRASRTGITEASKGLDPKAMQSTALAGVDAIVAGAQERIELIARVLAETGLKTMLKGMLREIVDNPNPERTIQLRGKWVNVNPSQYDATMRVQVNPVIGKGTDYIRMQSLMMIKEEQLGIMTKFGVGNQFVTPEHYMNTITDLAKIGGIRNMARYFAPITPELMQAVTSMPAEPDPATVLAQAELEKVKKDTLIAGLSAEQKQADIAIRQGELNLKAAKEKESADFKRDKLNIDAMLEAARIFQDSVTAMQTSDKASDMNRSPNG